MRIIVYAFHERRILRYDPARSTSTSSRIDSREAALRRTLRNVLYHPVLAIALFVLLAGAARFAPGPWWDGPVLEVRPELPAPSGHITDPPKYKAEVKEKVAQVDTTRTTR